MLNNEYLSIHIYNNFVETVNPPPELLFNKRKKGPRVVESLALGHTALDTGPSLSLASGGRVVAG